MGTRWTPERLAVALRHALGVSISRWTIRRACARGEIAGAKRTSGRQWRIPEATVRARWPQLFAHDALPLAA